MSCMQHTINHIFNIFPINTYKQTNQHIYFVYIHLHIVVSILWWSPPHRAIWLPTTPVWWRRWSHGVLLQIVLIALPVPVSTIMVPVLQLQSTGEVQRGDLHTSSSVGLAFPRSHLVLEMVVPVVLVVMDVRRLEETRRFWDPICLAIWVMVAAFQ